MIHEHTWKVRQHNDACHWFGSWSTCECGAKLETYCERSPMGTSMYLTGFEDMMDENCTRCNEILNGATLENRQKIHLG